MVSILMMLALNPQTQKGYVGGDVLLASFAFIECGCGQNLDGAATIEIKYRI